MTTGRLEQLNRAWRIRECLRNGVPRREIANAEGITTSRVDQIAHLLRQEQPLAGNPGAQQRAFALQNRWNHSLLPAHRATFDA